MKRAATRSRNRGPDAASPSCVPHPHNAPDPDSRITSYNVCYTKLLRIYLKENFSDEDGIRASELEGEFADLNGWEAESEAATLLAGLGVTEDMHDKMMKDIDDTYKVRILLAQAIFGNPDVLSYNFV